MTLKIKNPKVVELTLNSNRLNLLRQRLTGNDRRVDTNNFPNVNEQSPTSGYSENHLDGDQHSATSSRGLPFCHSDDSKRFIEEAQRKGELERNIREEYDRELERMRQFALEFVSEANVEKQKWKIYELSEKSERLGNITTSISGTHLWNGGNDVEMTEYEIGVITKKIDMIKKADNPSIGQKKAILQSMLKEKKSDLKQYEDERMDFAYLLKNNTDQNQSEFKFNQKLNEERYTLMEFSGRGGCSEVWKAFDTIEFRTVALKIQKMNPTWSAAVKDNFVRHIGREIQIMKSTQHQNVVDFFEYFYIGDNAMAIVMEYCTGGDLAMMLKKRGKIPEKEAKFIIAQIINGLLALRAEENYVIHYDLKPANVLFNDEGMVKITDFGLSKIVEGDMSSIELTSQGTGTFYYSAPETFQRGRSVYITKTVDTWSLGVIFYEMLYGIRPFKELLPPALSHTAFNINANFNTKVSPSTSVNNMNTFESPMENLSFPQGTKVSQQGKDFISLCLQRIPYQRPELYVLAQDPYIKQTIGQINV